MKIVLHAPTKGALNRARSQMRNLRKDAPDVKVRIVANAEAAAAVLDSPEESTRDDTFVCENSLAARGIKPPKNQPTIENAALHLAQLQEEGWSYIRT